MVAFNRSGQECQYSGQDKRRYHNPQSLTGEWLRLFEENQFRYVSEAMVFNHALVEGLILYRKHKLDLMHYLKKTSTRVKIT